MRFKSIDVLRGLAAAFVVFFHMWVRFFPELVHAYPCAVLPTNLAHRVLLFLFGFGYLGVNLFFVISGFCIHLPQAIRFQSGGSDQLGLKKFALRRFWRLYPAYFASLFWTSIVLAIFPLTLAVMRSAPVHLSTAADLHDLLVYAFFVEDIVPLHGSFNGVYWTLIYEIQFYFCYPILLWACRRVGFILPFFVLLGLEFIFVLKPVGVANFFLGRYYEWFLGMWLAERVASGKSMRFPIAVVPFLLAGLIASLFQPSLIRYHNILASTVFAVLLAACLDREPEWPWIGERHLVALGVFSYSLYLVHVPMIDLWWNGIYRIRLIRPAVPQGLSLLAIPAAFLLGHCFFRWFELPYLGQNKSAVKLTAGPKEQAW